MRKRRILAVAAAATLALSMVGCGSGGSSSGGSSSSGVANKDKPLCWFNRQPSNSSTGELDKDALSYNKDTYYVGFDANQGAELQGQMVLDYIKANAATIDRNGDGVIGYVLAIGDIGHNDSIARTRGVRSALGTGVDANGAVDSTPAGTNVDGKATVVQDAKLDVDGKTYTIRAVLLRMLGYRAADQMEAEPFSPAIWVDLNFPAIHPFSFSLVFLLHFVELHIGFFKYFVWPVALVAIDNFSKEFHLLSRFPFDREKNLAVKPVIACLIK